LCILSNLVEKFNQRDTIILILVLGESLLNDGIAITVFQTLVNRFDEKTTTHATSLDEIRDAFVTFTITMIGSIAMGVLSRCGDWLYYNSQGNFLPPVMEVGSYFLWIVIPYYICDSMDGWELF
jgi:NhaP-type Na+/H+ or K+/H+ antiporter